MFYMSKNTFKVIVLKMIIQTEICRTKTMKCTCDR